MMLIAAYAADILMIAASLGAAIYCLILSRRLSRLTSFDKGIGGAIAVLSAQVDEMKSALSEAKAGSEGASHHLQDLVRQARDISGELELMIAACHDFAEEALEVQSGAAGAPDSEIPAAPDPHQASPVRADETAIDDASDGREVATQESGPSMETVDPIPMFGTRRSPPPEPLFRHRAAQV